MNVRTPAMLLLALVPAGCSGTVPYSSTISETDVSMLARRSSTRARPCNCSTTRPAPST